MKVNEFNQKPASDLPSQAPQGQSTDGFQSLMQRLEQAMWSGAIAGKSEPLTVATKAPSTSVPSAITLVPLPQDPDARAALNVSSNWQTPISHHIDAAMPHIPLLACATRPTSGSNVVSIAATDLCSWLSVIPTARASGREEVPTCEHGCSTPPTVIERRNANGDYGDLIQLLPSATGLTLAIRLREDFPLDRAQLRRALSRVLAEQNVSNATLHINGQVEPDHSDDNHRIHHGH